MPLPNDITLNEIDYTLVPGGYRKRNAPATSAVNPRDVRRLTLGSFARGQRQALDPRPPTSDSRLATAGWDSVGVAPCFDGQGIEPFPHAAAFADGLGDTPSATIRAHGVIAGSNAFIGIGLAAATPLERPKRGSDQGRIRLLEVREVAPPDPGVTPGRVRVHARSWHESDAQQAREVRRDHRGPAPVARHKHPPPPPAAHPYRYGVVYRDFAVCRRWTGSGWRLVPHLPGAAGCLVKLAWRRRKPSAVPGGY
jgi:hypothetical protein